MSDKLSKNVKNKSKSTVLQIISFLKEKEGKTFRQVEVKKEKKIDKRDSTISEWFQALEAIGVIKKVRGKYSWYTYKPIDDLLEEIIQKFNSKYLRYPFSNEIMILVKRKYYRNGEVKDKIPPDAELRDRIEISKEETGWSEPSDDEVKEAYRRLKNRLCVAALLNFLEVDGKEKSIFKKIQEKREEWYEGGGRKIQVIGCDKTIIERAMVEGEIWENHLRGGKEHFDNHPEMLPEVDERLEDANVKLRFLWKKDVKHHFKKGKVAEEKETSVKIAGQTDYTRPVWKEECILHLFKLADGKPTRAHWKEVNVDKILELTKPKKWLPFSQRKRRGYEFYRFAKDSVPIWEITKVGEFIERIVKDPKGIQSEFGESSRDYFDSVRRCIETSFDLKSGSEIRDVIYKKALDHARRETGKDCKPVGILETFFERDSEKREVIFNICLEKIGELPLDSDLFSNYESIFGRSHRIGWKTREELEDIIGGMLKEEKINEEKGKSLFQTIE